MNAKRILRKLLESDTAEIIDSDDNLLLGPGWIFHISYVTPKQVLTVVKKLRLDTGYGAVVDSNDYEGATLVFFPETKLAGDTEEYDIFEMLRDIVGELDNEFDYIESIPEDDLEYFEGVLAFACYNTEYYDPAEHQVEYTISDFRGE